MIIVSISNFRKNMKKYTDLVKSEDIMVYSNGKPVMKITSPVSEKIESFRKLKGIAKADIPYEEIFKNKLNEI